MTITQIISIVVPIVLPLVVAIVGATWFLAGRFAKIDLQFANVNLQFARVDQQFTRIDHRLESIQATLAAHSQILAVLAGSLQRSGGLTPDDVTRLMQLISLGLTPQVGRTIEVATQGNPITQEEAARLRHYIATAQAGELFTEEEVKDLYNLARRVAEEVPDDPGAHSLVNFAAFLLGLYIGGIRKQA